MYNALVRKLYTEVINNETFAASDITGGAVKRNASLLTVINSINTSKFSVYCFMVAGVPPTTAERYMREFRAADRKLLEG